MAINIGLIFSLAVNIITIQCIVDFQYIQYNAKLPQAPLAQSILIHPNPEIFDYQFPGACRLMRAFQSTELMDDLNKQQKKDEDSLVGRLRQKFIEILKVAEKIKNRRANIDDISNLNTGLKNSSDVMPESDKKLLQKMEAKLNNLNDSIAQKIKQLQDLVYHNFESSQKNPLSIAAIDYDIESLTLKIEYLKFMFNQLQINNEKDNFQKVDDRIKDYFSNIQNKFSTQKQFLVDISQLLASSSNHNSLKQRLQSLKNKVQIANLMIQQKQDCLEEIKDIKQNQKNMKQIKDLMNNLREKKKNIDILGNKYCQGVAKKLADRLKNVLLSYDITFECAEGYQNLVLQKQKDLKEIKELQIQIINSDKTKNRQDFKRKITENNLYLQDKINEIKKIQIPEFQYSIQHITNLIKQAQKTLQDTLNKKTIYKNSSSNQVKPGEIDKIKKLINEIKQLKAQYCHHFERYEYKAQQIWLRVLKYQTQLQYKKKLNGVYNTELQNIRNLEIEFEKLKQQFIQQLS